jgi:hypothetical protein
LEDHSRVARLLNQFVIQNQLMFEQLGVKGENNFDGNYVHLKISTGTRVGAVPLKSPISGKKELGLIVKPRFGWSGIGSSLAQMGWRVIPKILNVPQLPRSERKIPPWILSSIILSRLKTILDKLERRFEFNESDLLAPRGSINWLNYLTNKIPNSKFLSVPCRYPDLRDDRLLIGAIHHVLRKHLDSLESQRQAGIIVLKLIDFCLELLNRVRAIPPTQPSPIMLQMWLKGPLKTSDYQKGIQAIEWTIEERGLAGMSDLHGLPWVMDMASFFEAWIEAIAERLINKIGGLLKLGRKMETIAPLRWQPAYLGSQKYLLPDIIIDKDDRVIIIDAKYKDHWEELNIESWRNIAEEIRNRHREDLLQILAYSTLFEKKNVICCLTYPCYRNTWTSLKNRNRVFHYASVIGGKRNVGLALTAVPIDGTINDGVETLTRVFHHSFSESAV